MCTHLIHGSLGPPNSASQTASRSVQPVLHSSRQTVPTLYSGPPLSPLKVAPSHGDLDSHLTVLPWAHPSPHPRQLLDRFSRFCRAHNRDRQIDSPRYCAVTIGHMYVCSTAMQPNNVDTASFISSTQSHSVFQYNQEHTALLLCNG